MLDWGLLPPEINSANMYAGPGSGPMLAAAAAWDELAADLYSTASQYGAVISGLTAGWLGPSSMSMAAAAMPYVSWISATAGQAQEAGTQAKAAVSAYEAAFTMTVPPPVIAANRALLMALIATNFLGQNTPAIMATEAQYIEMWAQDAAAMYGYAGASAAATQLTQFTPPAQTISLAGVAGQTASVNQAAATGAGTGSQTLASMGTMTAPMSVSTVPNALAAASSTPSSTLPPTSATALSSMVTPATSLVSGSTSSASGAGTAVSMLSSMTGMNGFMNTMSSSATGAFSVFGNQSGAFGSMFGAGPGALGSQGLGAPAVSAAVGRATTIGTLSVPQAWATAAPAFNNPITASLTSANASVAAPAIAPANPAGMYGPPWAPFTIARGVSAPMASATRLDVFRPSVIPRMVAAG